MHPTLFTIGGLEIATYGVTFATGILVGVILSYRRASKEGIDPEMLLVAMIIGVIGLVLGSKIAHIIVTWDWYMAKPSRLWNLRRGHVYYGGYIGGILVPLIYLRIKKIPILKVLDIWMTYSMIGLGIHRTFGCPSAGCCFGKPTTLPWGITYPAGAPASEAYGLVPVHPTQIYEAILAFSIAGFLIWWRRDHKKVDGELLAIQMAVYATGRFLIEFVRGDSIRGLWGPLSTSQWVSLGTLIVIVPLVLYIRKKRALLRATGGKKAKKK